MHRPAQSLSGVAVLSAAFCTPAAAFVTAPAAAGPVPSLRAVSTSANVGRAADAPEQRIGAAASAATALAAASAGAMALARRRAATARRVNSRPLQVIEWQVDPQEPVPGSEKALAGMVGADVETGGSEPWDPMGFSKLYDRNFDFNMVMTYPHVQWLREAEIKHGRVCMLAFVGMLAQQFVHIPGYPAEPDWLKALDACYQSKLPTLGLIQISLFTMLVEGKYYSGDAWIGQMDREPGDLGFDPLKLTKTPGFNLKEFQLKELKNGRLAMLAFLSIVLTV